MPFSTQDTGWGAAGNSLLEIGKILALQKREQDDRQEKINDQLRTQLAASGFHGLPANDAALQHIVSQPAQRQLTADVSLPPPAKLAGVPSVNLPDTLAPSSSDVASAMTGTDVPPAANAGPPLPSLLNTTSGPALAAPSSAPAPQVLNAGVLGSKNIYQEAATPEFRAKVAQTLDPNNPMFGATLPLPSGRATFTAPQSEMATYVRSQNAGDQRQALEDRLKETLAARAAENAASRAAALTRLKISDADKAEIAANRAVVAYDDAGNAHLIHTSVAPGATTVAPITVSGGALGKTKTEPGAQSRVRALGSLPSAEAALSEIESLENSTDSAVKQEADAARGVISAKTSGVPGAKAIAELRGLAMSEPTNRYVNAVNNYVEAMLRGSPGMRGSDAQLGLFYKTVSPPAGTWGTPLQVFQKMRRAQAEGLASQAGTKLSDPTKPKTVDELIQEAAERAAALGIH